ncbi:MAG: hypothetical protein CSB13_06670 [Chloroflexi bacterium]|nr:MAG: hypothetical protein CSB13_06670 [Chloroflexota bacterium]
MAKRKNQLADKLGGTTTEARPGWRDTILTGLPTTPVESAEDSAPLPPKRTPSHNKPMRKTYYLPPPLIKRIEILAEEEQVGISALVTFLLNTSVELVESGHLEIPTAPARRQIVQ